MQRGGGKDKQPENQWEQEQAILQPEKVMKLLKEQGIDITYEQAEFVGHFLHQFSNIIVSNFLQNEQNS
jgi:hypothetical protein